MRGSLPARTVRSFGEGARRKPGRNPQGWSQVHPEYNAWEREGFLSKIAEDVQELDREELRKAALKIIAQRDRARSRAHRYYRPYSSLSGSEKAKRLEYGRSYRQRQKFIMELAVEEGVIEPPKRRAAQRRLPPMQDAKPRPSLALMPVPRRKQGGKP